MNIPRMIGHRGAAAYAPENTRASFKKAHELGAHWVEFDAQPTADGKIVVLHDERLSRVTNGVGHGHVADHSYAELKRFDFGSWFDVKFANEKLLTLDELLVELRSFNMNFNVELKSWIGQDEKIIQSILKSLDAHIDPSREVLLSSFNIDTLRFLKSLGVSYPIAPIFENWNKDCVAIAKELDAASLNAHHTVLTERRVKMIKDAGFPVLAYTVNKPPVAEKLFAWGVDGIFTDDLLLFESTVINI